MTQPTPSLDDLTPSARGALAELAGLFAGRFTGKVEIDCSQGAVVELKKTVTTKGANLARPAAGR